MASRHKVPTLNQNYDSKNRNHGFGCKLWFGDERLGTIEVYLLVGALFVQDFATLLLPRVGLDLDLHRDAPFVSAVCR